jgi:hypothetical protein
MNERKNVSNEQLELEFQGAQRRATPPRRGENRATRAAWWFAQMRQIVNSAMDWQPAPTPPPEQEWLGLSHHRQSA